MKPKLLRDISFPVNLNKEERELLQSLFEESTCRSVSEYLRNTCLRKPVTIRYRNQSVDELLILLIQIKKELIEIRSLYKQNLLDRNHQATGFESDPLSLEKNITEIKELMNQIYQQCSHT
jgi:MobC-like protein